MNELEKLQAEKQRVLNEIRQLENRQKALTSKQLDAERRLRTRRLIERGAMLESVFPELALRQNTDVMAFLAVVSRLPQAMEWLAKVDTPKDVG